MLATKPKESLTERESFLYKVYCTARDCITGSMVKLYTDLGMENDEFYRLFDTDLEFSNAIKCGLSDSRGFRLIELESALITLALGQTVTEKKVTDDEDGHSETVTEKHYLPNLSALQVLLEKYEGSSWSITQKVELGFDSTPMEIDYSMLSKEQLRLLAKQKGGNE